MDSDGHGHRDVDDLIAAALAAGASYEQAGEAAGVSKSTVRRRMADPEFRAVVAEARDEMVVALRGRLLQAFPNALVTLQDLATGSESESVRLGAARSLIGFACERRSDPVGEAMRGVTSIAPADLRAIVGSVMDEAMKLIPEEKHEQFVLAVKRIGMGR